MAIDSEQEAQILRYYYVEKWRPGTLARQLHVHHGTVARVLAQSGVVPSLRQRRPRQIEAYLPFIRETVTTQVGWNNIVILG